MSEPREAWIEGAFSGSGITQEIANPGKNSFTQPNVIFFGVINGRIKHSVFDVRWQPLAILVIILSPNSDYFRHTSLVSDRNVLAWQIRTDEDCFCQPPLSLHAKRCNPRAGLQRQSGVVPISAR